MNYFKIFQTGLTLAGLAKDFYSGAQFLKKKTENMEEEVTAERIQDLEKELLHLTENSVELSKIALHLKKQINYLWLTVILLILMVLAQFVIILG